MRSWLATLAIAVLAHPTLGQCQNLLWDGAAPTAALAQISLAKGLKIFWWNTHSGRVNEAKPDSDFDQNLTELMQSPDLAPDVLAFAEFREDRLLTAESKLLQTRYPYSITRAYTFDASESVAVFSRYPITVVYEDTLTNIAVSYERPLLVLNVQLPGQTIRFIPVHIADTWRDYLAKNGSIETGLEILGGTTNPVAEQMNQLTSKLTAKLGANFMSTNTVMVGDFNQPDTLLGLSTKEFQIFAAGWKNAIPNSSPTFPAAGSDEASSFPSMAIDHALVSPPLSVPAGTPLQLRGSDHYPLYFVVGGIPSI
jgi:endonuclease/exonuclease/phosphatase family metal-dependent hydrolase